MASNPYVNKVTANGVVIVDLTADTVTASTLMQGYTAHDKSGALITGTADKTEGSVYQDQDGYLVVDDSESSAPQGNISITQNGTYDVADYAGANVSIPVGATNVVIGEFTASTAGSVQEVSVSYSGDGWPVAIFVFPKDGYRSGSALYDTDHQYAIIEVSAFVFASTSSAFSSGYGAYLYKSQATGMTVGGTRINGSNMFGTQNNPTSSNGCVVVRDKNGFAVSVSSAAGSYGFLSGVGYKYVVVYSS